MTIQNEKTRWSIVPVQIVRYTEDSQPGWVAVELQDAFGSIHSIEDKYPFFYDGYLDAQSPYPLPAEYPVVVTERWTADDGREFARIYFDEIECVVLAEQVQDIPNPSPN